MRFPGFDGEWEVKKLGDLLEFKNGINASKEQYGKGIKFINVLDILNNDFITSENIVGRVNVDNITVEKFSVKYGDILFQRSSETREEVGTANVYLDKENTATFGGFVIRGRKIGDYEPIFFNKLLKTDSARDSITSKSGGSTRFNVGQEILISIALHFPSIIEQQKIASLLSIIDERIQTQNKIILELESSIKGLIRKIFSQKLRFKNDNNLEFPHWENKCLGEICEKKSSNISANKIEDNFGKYIIYGASGVLKRVDFYEEKKDYISIVKDGAGVGRLFYCEGKSSVLGTMDIIKPLVNTNTYFLFYLLRNIDFAKYVTGSTIPHIYFKDYKNENFGIPCIEEQNKIANFLSQLEQKIKIEKQLLTQYENQKKYLLQNLFI
ncbi:MAG TPA: restriction endonuclease subunit S [Flavobacterium sp.]|nr:restriction endonuclease subunit S [Flavobacterium sp.]